MINRAESCCIVKFFNEQIHVAWKPDYKYLKQMSVNGHVNRGMDQHLDSDSSEFRVQLFSPLKDTSNLVLSKKFPME